jgi:hypothetical protein
MADCKIDLPTFGEGRKSGKMHMLAAAYNQTGNLNENISKVCEL